MADKDTPYSAPWTDTLRHRPDPNRAGSGVYGTGAAPANATPPAIRNPGTLTQRPEHTSPQQSIADNDEPSYYDVPLLKAPLWKWEIASYFFLGGLSAGAYILSRMADRFGGKRYRDLSRAGSYAALASFLPCPPLLIHDLGDPKRFHHMLRVWKPSTPMNLGTWTIVGYSGMAAYDVFRQYLRSRATRSGKEGWLLRFVDSGPLVLAHDLASIPFALLVAGYTGVLLSCTANPLWCQNPWLGPLFSSSAIATGAAATSLALDLTSDEVESDSHNALDTIDTAAHVAEAVTLAGFLKHAGERAKPLTHGSMKKHLLFSAAGLIGAEVLKRLPLEGRAKKAARVASSLLGLAAGFSLRWAMVYGGHEAANDPHLARLPQSPNPQAPKRKAVANQRPGGSLVHA